MKLKIIVAACALAFSGMAAADAYKFEVGAGVIRSDDDVFNEQDNLYVADGKYYFNAVTTDNLPLAESAYLGKNSNVFAEVLKYPRQNGARSATGYKIGAEFYIPESFLYVSAGATRVSSGNFSDNDWFTTVGITPIDGLLITTTYSDDEGYDPNLRAKYVTDIGNGHFINLEAEVIDYDGATYKEIGGDFYFDNTLSVGGAIADTGSENEYQIRARKFFTERFSGEVSYTDFNYGNQIMAGVDFRF